MVVVVVYVGWSVSQIDNQLFGAIDSSIYTLPPCGLRSQDFAMAYR
jgi:hypothetical protein